MSTSKDTLNKTEIASDIAFKYVDAIASNNKETHSKFDRHEQTYRFIPKYQDIFDAIYNLIFENLEKDL